MEKETMEKKSFMQSFDDGVQKKKSTGEEENQPSMMKKSIASWFVNWCMNQIVFVLDASQMYTTLSSSPLVFQKPSQRILMNTAFSTFTNTADDPVLLDEEDSDTAEKPLRRVRNKSNEKPDSSLPMEDTGEVFDEKREPGVETLLKDLTMEDINDTDETTHDEYESTFVAGATSQKNTPKCTIEIESLSRVTRSQKKKKELETDSTQRKGEVSRRITRESMNPLASETKVSEKKPDQKDVGSSSSQRIRAQWTCRKQVPLYRNGTKLLKKRESTELEDGGFGLLPLTYIGGTREEILRTERKSGKVDNGQQQRQQSRLEELMHLIRERIARIRELKAEAESDIQRGLTEYVNDDEFPALQSEMNRLFKSTTPFGGTTPKSPTKTIFLNPCTNIILSQQTNDPLAALWDSLTYVGEVDELMRVSVENSKARRFLNAIEPPGFDLGIIPMKFTTSRGGDDPGRCGSGLRVDKGKEKLFDEPTDAVVCDSEPRVTPVHHANPLRMINPPITQSGPSDDKV
ncbi:hypothetical protein L6452_09627 [Arctium lappa]|uniref:Uncharacterized protein n=1 Tax=Arctium lappa TaxID=4217 RepID=A0ACB9DL30_ARCLA|nr:hypothetical protein L6452_09627 [Arctium lappa]